MHSRWVGVRQASALQDDVTTGMTDHVLGRGETGDVVSLPQAARNAELASRSLATRSHSGGSARLGPVSAQKSTSSRRLARSQSDHISRTDGSMMTSHRRLRSASSAIGTFGYSAADVRLQPRICQSVPITYAGRSASSCSNCDTCAGSVDATRSPPDHLTGYRANDMT